MFPWKLLFRFFSAMVLMATGGYAAGHDLPMPFDFSPTQVSAPPAAPVTDPSTTTTTDSSTTTTTTADTPPVVVVPAPQPDPVPPTTAPKPPTTTTTVPLEMPGGDKGPDRKKHKGDDHDH